MIRSTRRSPPNPDFHRPATWLAALSLAGCGSMPEAPLAGEAGTWEPRASMEIARQETAAAVLGDSVYVLGGLLDGPPLAATASVEIYDLLSGSWSFGPSMPAALDHAAASVVGDQLMVMGGFSADFQARAEVWVFDRVAAEWSPGPPLPEPRGAAWAVAHGGRVYLFGGLDGNGAVTTSTFIFDPGSGWSEGAPMPTAREHLNAVVLGQGIHVLGGRGRAATAAHERYDPVRDQWEVLAPMPTARSAMAAAALDGRIVAAGGEVPMLFAVTEIYDPDGDAWCPSEPMAVPRHGVAAVVVDGCLLAPGGGVVQGLEPTTHVDCFAFEGEIAVRDAAPGLAPRLLAARPNPFGRATELDLVLAETTRVRLRIVDARGRLVRTLIDRWLPGGQHRVSWDGTDDARRSTAAGVYLARLDAGSTTRTRKLVVLR